MKHITFLGAAGTVTGSSYFLSDQSGKGIIIDMGMFQGSHQVETYNYESIPLHPQNITAVFLTHAHLDHCGRLPLLRKFGYTGPILMTPATKALVELTLLDAAAIAKHHENGKILYNEDDVHWIISHARPVQYHQEVDVGSFFVTFRDAGHILGSSFLDIRCKQTNDGISRIIFSGDIGNYPEEIVKPTETVKDADVVIMESTYGDRAHASENPEEVIAEEIEAIEKSGGTLLIPAFSIERSQELLHMIDHLKKDKKVKEETLVFLDSVLAIHVTQVYEQFRNLYNDELAMHAKADDPFNFPGLQMVEHHKDSLRIGAFPGPKVIIAGSGMMTGGRILRHAQEYLGNPSTRILFVGFQAEETLGREILDGAKKVSIEGLSIPVAASVRRSSGLSSHADQPKLLAWLSSIKGVSSVCLTHGENPQRQILAEEITKKWPNVAVYRPKKPEQLTFGSDQPKYVRFGAS